MKENEINNEIDVEDLVDSVGYEFLDFLAGEKVISENFGRKTKALVEIDSSKVEGELLMEADIAKYNKDGVIIPSANIQVSYKNFAAVWQDPIHYSDTFEIFNAFGVPHKTFQKLGGDTPDRYLRRMLKAYRQAKRAGLHNGPDLVDRGLRKKEYAPPTEDDEQKAPTKSDIHPGERGRRNKTTNTLDRLNAQELLSGEFYSNKSRIPRSRWANWLKFWDRRRTRVRPNTGDKRKWEKHFLMGYQIDRHILFEIWFNTADSTFIIHDQNGAELGRPVATLQEAMRYFVNQITTASEQDADIFAGGGVNNQVANSMMRAVASELSKDSAQAEREAMLAQKSEEDFDHMDQARKDYEGKKLQQKLKREDRVQYAKDLGKAALEVPTNLQRSAYIKMMGNAKGPTQRVAVALRASLDSALKNAKDKDQINGYMVDQMRGFMKDYVDDETVTVTKIVREFLKDPMVRAEIQARFEDSKRDSEEEKREEIRQRVKDAEEKFRADTERKNDEAAEKTRKEREKAEKKGKKALGDKFDVLNRKKANKQADQTIEKYRSKQKDVKESMSPEDWFMQANAEADEAEAEDLGKFLNSPTYDQHVNNLQRQADSSPYTQSAIASAVMSDLIYTYNQSRMPASMKNKKVIQARSRWDRIKQKIQGKHTRADFVVGYSLNDKVNVEVWYVTEWDFDQDKPISSFHVFDVTSQTVIRRYLPYYRNAVTVAISKIGLTTSI